MTAAKIRAQSEDRRTTPVENDSFYRFIIGLSVTSWGLFLVALVVFHYARPEATYGMQEFWGVHGREHWSASLSLYLIILLSSCMLLSSIVLLLKRQRTRRARDHYGANGFVMLFVSLSSLIALYFELS